MLIFILIKMDHQKDIYNILYLISNHSNINNIIKLMIFIDN